MGNQLVQSLACDNRIRLYIADLTQILTELTVSDLSMPRLLKEALGKTASAACLLTGTLKGDDRLSIKLSSTNRGYAWFAESDAYGNISAYLSDSLAHTPADYWNGLTEEQLIGERGSIRIAKSIGMNGMFTGVTDMPNRNIEADFSHYYGQSEQTATAFRLHITFDKYDNVVFGRAIMIQMLPGSTDQLWNEALLTLDNQSARWRTPDISTGEVPENIFADARIVGTMPLRLFCGCSKELLMPMILSLGDDTLRQARYDAKDVEIVCHRCGRGYRYSPSEVDTLLNLK